MADELSLMKGHLYSALWRKALHFHSREGKRGNQKTGEGLILRGFFVCLFCFSPNKYYKLKICF